MTAIDAIKRKFLMPALLSAITVAGVVGCSTGGATKGAEGAAEKEAGAAKQVAAPSTEATTGDPFAGMSAAQIARKAVTATKGAKSLRLTAEGTENGKRLKVDFSLDNKGTCAGGLRRDDSEAEFAVVNGVTYVKGDDEFWRSLASGGNDPNPESPDPGRADELVQLLSGKWLKIPASGNSPARALGGACDLDAMLGTLNTADTKGLTRGAAAEVDGRKAVTLVKREGGRTQTTFVAAEGAPYLLKAVSEGGQAPGTVLFGDFGVPVKATVPPAGDTVDLGDIRGAANPPTA
ncbi:hypothetical protein [Streptomyces sp. NPDC058665]|uniref:hypothetical protein n=1 Tax=Streptomyces sp. NPDC058665 TaxID=3346586 RepID=UPI0036513D38